MNYRMIINTTGKIMIIGGATLIAPLLISLIYHDGNVIPFLMSIAVFFIVGAAGIMVKPRKSNMYAKEGMIIVTMGWILFSLAGALPFYISREIPSFVNCFFETVSGFTTTGSSILTDVEALSKSMLFWRSFTHWIGGMGVLVFITAIFSQKNTRTTYIMRAEMPGMKVGKIAAKWQFSIRILYAIYVALTLIEFVLLMLGKMSAFDAFVHAMGTAGTGGFGIKAASIGAYNSAYIEYVIAVFMMLFGINFNVYYLILVRKISQVRQNGELKIYLGIIIAATVIIAINIYSQYQSAAQAIRYSFFQVNTIITTTGYATADFCTWPMLSQMILVLLMFVGGCAGSTGGGIKVVRIGVLVKSAYNEIKRSVSPRSVATVKCDGKMLEKSVADGVMAYFAVFMLLMAVSILIISLDNKDAATTVTSVISAMNNIGPGLGEIGPTGSYESFSVLSKIVLSIDMLAGRLELYPILVLLAPSTWKRL